MPCSDSSSGLNIRLDLDEHFVSYQFGKITCSREINASTEYEQFCKGKSLQEILDQDFFRLVDTLGFKDDEEKQYVLHLEWEALRSGIAQYLGVERDDIDTHRCQITSIEYDEDGIEIAEIVLPPSELPKILPCSLAN